MEYKSLGELCTITSSKRIFAEQYVDEGVPFYRSKEIIEKNANQDISLELFISEEVYNSIKERFGVPQEGDLLMTSVGTIGIPYVVKKERFYFKDGNLTWMKDFSEEINSQYLYYWFSSKFGKQSLVLKAIGSSQPALTIDILKNYKLLLPDRKQQDKIVMVMSQYDLAIENNNKRIKILEQMAENLYKEWFVRFRFPGHEDVEFEGGIPKGWEIVKIGDRFKTVLGGTPSREKTEYWGGNIPWINSGEINKSRITNGSEFITEIGYKKSATELMPTHTTVVAITGATLGQVSFTEVEVCANQSVVGIIDEEHAIEFYLFGAVKQNISDIINYASGGAQQHINKDVINKYKIVIPQRDVVCKYEKYMKVIDDEINNLVKQNDCLIKQRDLLLPRLMSGKLEVK